MIRRDARLNQLAGRTRDAFDTLALHLDQLASHSI